MKYLIGLLFMSLSMSFVASAQDNTFDPDAIPNFGRVLLQFDVPMEDNNFLLAKHIAAQPDLSRIYVGSGAAGIVLIFDNKGNLLGEADVLYETPVTDMAVGYDGNLYTIQYGNIYVYDPDGTRIREISGDFLNDISYDRVVPMPDKTIYALDVFSEKDRLYHISADGDTLFTSELGFFSTITGSQNDIFDEFKLGQDGYLYYFNNEGKQMVQLDADLEVINIYDDLITDPQNPQRSAMLIDKDSKVLFGNNGGIEMYGNKEALIHTIKLDAEYSFVYDIAFADDGVLVAVQNTSVTILQYGLRDEEAD